MTNSSEVVLHVHLVEDDSDLREEMVFGLAGLGFEAIGFGSAEAFYRGQLGSPCDIAVIDVGLPGEDGFSIATHLRATSRVGIVMLTARSQLEDRLRGLKDADLYMVKPVDLLELAASLRSLGRRLKEAQPERRAGGEWRLADEDWTLYAPAGTGIHLTASERMLMQALFVNRDKAVSRESIAAALGGDIYDYDLHRLETLISRLRKKASDVGLSLPLRAVRGIGYLFSPRSGRG